MASQTKTKTPTKKIEREFTRIQTCLIRVLEQNPWADAQRPMESRRMFHDRIAERFASAVRTAFPRREVIGWAIYGGEEKWTYAVKMGGHIVFLEWKADREEADPQ